MLSSHSPFENIGATNSPSGLSGAKWTIKRQVLKLVGAAFFVHDENGVLALYADQKAFKWKEDIRIYSGEDKKIEVLRIAARGVMDFRGIYDVFDSASNQKLGALQRRGMKSMLRDEWSILDASDREMGAIIEDSMVLALIRRFVEFLALLVPQKYGITVGNRDVGQFARTFNPLITKIEANFSADSDGLLDRRLAIAAGVLMCAIEGKQG